MYTPKKTVKEKLDMQTSSEKQKVIANIPATGGKEAAIGQLDVWMYAHNFPEGWKREIMSILKPVLQ